MAVEISCNGEAKDIPEVASTQDKVNLGQLASFAVNNRGFQEGNSRAGVIHPSEVYGAQAWFEVRSRLGHHPTVTVEAADSTVEL